MAVCPLDSARAFIEAHHYARGASKTAVLTMGLYPTITPDWLAGVTWWLPPTKAAAVSVSPDRWKEVLGLSRMAVFPALGRNACSFMLARAVRHLRASGRWHKLVTYADESQGHEGLVYRASGWTYEGRVGPKPRWIDPRTGRQVSTQATRTRTVAEMTALGYVNTGSFFKHKYTYTL